jgi:hypothetical protein
MQSKKATVERKNGRRHRFLVHGAPPRKFKVIGFITDSRFKSGLIGMMRMSGLDSSIAKETRRAGGDAVIIKNSEVETKAVFHNLVQQHGYSEYIGKHECNHIRRHDHRHLCRDDYRTSPDQQHQL